MTDSALAAEIQLLGCMLHMGTPEKVLEITNRVPTVVLADPLNKAIWSSADALARAGVCDPATVGWAVSQTKLWPADLHGDVSSRIVDAMAGCIVPAGWRPWAAQVLDANARRVIATHLLRISESLKTDVLFEVARALFASAQWAETAVDLIRYDIGIVMEVPQ